MAQVTIYLPDELESKVRNAAKARGQSVSRWIAEQIVQNLEDTWPKSVLDAAGAAPDFPDTAALRRGYGLDARRERID